MSKQQDLHVEAGKHLSELKAIIDKLKYSCGGPCEMDGWNALLNTQQHLIELAARCRFEGMEQGRFVAILKDLQDPRLVEPDSTAAR